MRYVARLVTAKRFAEDARREAGERGETALRSLAQSQVALLDGLLEKAKDEREQQ